MMKKTKAKSMCERIENCQSASAKAHKKPFKRLSKITKVDVFVFFNFNFLTRLVVLLSPLFWRQRRLVFYVPMQLTRVWHWPQIFR